jgi:hypothetical protein
VSLGGGGISLGGSVSLGGGMVVESSSGGGVGAGCVVSGVVVGGMTPGSCWFSCLEQPAIRNAAANSAIKTRMGISSEPKVGDAGNHRHALADMGTTRLVDRTRQRRLAANAYAS